jgi:uncharacterized protein (DUF1800 family)
MPPLDKISGQLGNINAAHLLRRATFGTTPQLIQQFSTISIDQALEILFSPTGNPQPPVDPKTGATWLSHSAGDNNSSQENLVDYYMAWHLEQMRNSQASIKERIVWFLHTHLPTRRTLVLRSEYLYYQNKLYREYAFDSYKTLFRKLCVDNAMLIYLDNGLNRNLSPNENFAREMFELYTIGRGDQIEVGNYTNYTEDDVRAAARILTGYETDDSFTSLDIDTNIPSGKLITETVGIDLVANEHDPGTKQFSEAFQNRSITPTIISNGFATSDAAIAELDELIDMIFDQDETARFITRKLYRFFVYYEIDELIENQIIIPLAEIFRTNNYSLSHLIRTLLGSIHFFDTDNVETYDDNKGAIIKSPIEIITGTCRLFNIEFPGDVSQLYEIVYQKGLIEAIYKQGLNLYEPYDVAGYDAYFQFPTYNRNWITPYYLAYRYKFADILINGINHGGESLGIKLNILEWVKITENVNDPSNASALVNRFAELMFPFQLPAERLAFFLNTIFLDGLYESAWTQEWNNYLNNPGTYEASVRTRLEILVRAMIQSPEYQLF